jgi:hypothetical protein
MTRAQRKARGRGKKIRFRRVKQSHYDEGIMLSPTQRDRKILQNLPATGLAGAAKVVDQMLREAK